MTGWPPLRGAGDRPGRGRADPAAEGKASVLAVVGKAGSGKTMLLAELYQGLKAAGSRWSRAIMRGASARTAGRWRFWRRPTRRQSVLRLRGVPATTIHRILYTPVYDPEYEKIAEWLAGRARAGDRSRG
jgi:exodeoxyribonuclease-5